MTDNTETVTLSKPIKTHDGEIASITLKEPSARSFFSHGEPFKVRVVSDESGDRVEFDYNNAVLKHFLADMSGHDDLVLAQLRASDYTLLRQRAVNMIVGVAGSNPTET